MEMLRLGNKMVIVFTVETLKTGEAILEVLSVTPRSLNIIPHLDFECPPLEKLFRDRRQSPWSFVISLAYMTGVLAAPRLYAELLNGKSHLFHCRGYYLHLRLGLLLSLATRDTRRLNVLSLGAEDTATSRVMRECAELGPGAVVHTDRAALGGERLQGGRQGVDMVTAGELHLARDGVLIVNNITSCKQATKVSEHLGLEGISMSNISGGPCPSVRIRSDPRHPHSPGDEGGSVGLGELLQPPPKGESRDQCPGHRPDVPPHRVQLQ